MELSWRVEEIRGWLVASGSCWKRKWCPCPWISWGKALVGHPKHTLNIFFQGSGEPKDLSPPVRGHVCTSQACVCGQGPWQFAWLTRLKFTSLLMRIVSSLLEFLWEHCWNILSFVHPPMAIDKRISKYCRIVKLQVLVKCQDSQFPLPQFANAGNFFFL